MLRDHKRNQALRGAIEKVIKKVNNETNGNFIVLDIGAGQGLLSMIAARAGASQVFSVEKDAAVCEIAKEIIKLNGYEKNIKYLNKESFNLEVGEGKDLPERADVLLSENLDSYFFGEQILVIIKHARDNLLKPNAKIIPAGGKVFGQIIESTYGFGKDSIIEGFDMTPLRPHRSATSTPIDYRSHPHINITEPFLAFSINFEKDDLLSGSTDIIVEATNSGCINGFALWWTANCDEEGEFIISTEEKTHWEQAIMLLTGDLIVEKGDKLRVVARQDTKILWFDLERA